MNLTLGLRGQLGIFSALFAGGMWMSKVAQPLHYEHANALVAFGVGYAAMAVVGGFSFAWGALADRLGGLNAVRIGAVVYAIGIAGRVFTDLLPTTIFSCVAGAGASLALIGIRPWIRSQATDQEIPKIVGARHFGSEIGIAVGTVGAAGVFALASQGDSGTVWALQIAPVLVLLGVVWLWIVARSTVKPAVSQLPSSDAVADPAARRSFRALAIRLALIGVLSGFYVSLIVPYLPLFLTGGGLSDSGAAITLGVMSLAQVAVSWVISRRGMSERPFKVFFVAEAVTGAVTIGIGFLAGVPVIFVAALFIFRAAWITLAATAEETIQYAVIPGSAAGFVFGISQTAFLVGDALGGAIGAPLWLSLGPGGLAVISGAAAIANAFCFRRCCEAGLPGRSSTQFFIRSLSSLEGYPRRHQESTLLGKEQGRLRSRNRPAVRTPAGRSTWLTERFAARALARQACREKRALSSPPDARLNISPIVATVSRSCLTRTLNHPSSGLISEAVRSVFSMMRPGKPHASSSKRRKLLSELPGTCS